MRTTTVGLAIMAIGIPVLVFNGASKPDEGWTSEFAQAQATAKKTGKLVLVDFNATWCEPCQMLRHEVFSTDEFKRATQDVLLVSVDIDRQPALAQKYGVQGIPDVRLLAPSGKVVGGVVGYDGPATLMSEIARARSAIQD